MVSLVIALMNASVVGNQISQNLFVFQSLFLVTHLPCQELQTLGEAHIYHLLSLRLALEGVHEQSLFQLKHLEIVLGVDLGDFLCRLEAEVLEVSAPLRNELLQLLP